MIPDHYGQLIRMLSNDRRCTHINNTGTALAASIRRTSGRGFLEIHQASDSKQLTQ
jgi:hypothetical protein